MACVYEFKGHLFNNELELDEFLLEREPYRTTLGDIVFNKEISAALYTPMDNVEKLKQKGEELHNLVGERVWDLDGKTYTIKLPYHGVNAFLTRYRDSNGNRLFPEFIESNYWYGETGTGGRVADWKNGKFTDDEKSVFFINTSPTAITDPLTIKECINKMKEKWEYLCLYGDAVHSVLEKLLIRDVSLTNVVYRYDLVKDNNEALEDFINELNNETYTRSDKSTITFGELVSYNTTKRIITEAFKLIENFRDTFGKNAIFYPEIWVSGQLSEKINDCDKLLGKIDLLVIDQYGKLHIVDYKTSIKRYDDYHRTKRLTYTYQLATYGKLLRLNNFSTHQTKYYICPIQLSGFKKDSSEGYSMDSISLLADTEHVQRTDLDTKYLVNINSDVHWEKVDNNLDLFVQAPMCTAITSDKLLSNVSNWMATVFPKYNTFTQYSYEEVEQLLKDDNAFVRNEEDKFVWKPKGAHTNTEIVANSEAELVKKVLLYKNSLPERRDSLVEDVISALKTAIEAGSAKGIDFARYIKPNQQTINPEWFNLMMDKFCRSEYEVLESGQFETLKHLGIITLKNNATNLFDFVKISTLDLKYARHFGGRTRNTLAGKYHTDLHYSSKSKNLMLDAVAGNIEMMEVMAALNNMTGVFGDNGIIGNILVADPIHGLGLTASNEELYYSFNELMDGYSKEESLAEYNTKNNFKDDSYLADKTLLAYNEFKSILAKGGSAGVNWSGDYAQFTGYEKCMDMLHASIEDDVDAKLEALENLRKEMERRDKNGVLSKIETNLNNLTDNYISLYNSVILAIAELRGIDYRLQLSDHAKWLETDKILTKGVSGSYIDNPGNLKSETLNFVTKLVTQAYQKVRSLMAKPSNDIKKLIKQLMDEKRTTDTYKLYSNLYDLSDGDIKFKNPWKANDLSDTEKQLIKLAITKINSRRFGNFSIDVVEKTLDPKYFQVPLKSGKSNAFTTPESLVKLAKDKLAMIKPDNLGQTIKDVKEATLDKYEQWSSEQHLKRLDSSTNLFELLNTFRIGETAERLKYIERKGVRYFESDLQSILLGYEFAHIYKDAIDDVLPLIKASAVHLTRQGLSLNTEFVNDLEYLQDYIKNKIKNESIIDPRYQDAAKKLSWIRKQASRMVLAFSPVQFAYQMIQGMWTDISLVLKEWAKGGNTFTKTNMIKAAKIVYADMFRNSNTPSVVSKLNELYGINDMDINTYTKRLALNQDRWENFMFKFTSRPDYYNRMTILVALMLADGSFYAHKLDADGNLVYDPKLDKRYEKYYLDPKNPDKESYAKYITAFKQFYEEGYLKTEEDGYPKNEVGKPLKIGDKLPRAYTTLEMESIKDLADTIYGYYSSEKRSLIHETLAGSMWMQMRTYWSGKKNLYLAHGGVKLQGHWELLKDGEDLLYYQVDSNGKVLVNLPPTKTDTGIPFYQWRGDWKEGILKTLIDFGAATISEGPGSAWQKYWYSEDPILRAAYRLNITLLLYDLSMLMIVGTSICSGLRKFLDDLEDNASKDDLVDGFMLSMVNIGVKSVSNSFLDFNFIKSIGDPVVSWNPFSLSYIGSTVTNVWDMVTGDKNVLLGMADMTSATRLLKPLFKSVKYNLQ